MKNGGYGRWLSRWTTLTTEALCPIASLCLRNGKKVVTQAWLDQLTWEGIAWWYQDEGGLSGNTVVFNTHGFTIDEVELLKHWLESHGLVARKYLVTTKAGRQLPILRLPPSSSYDLILHLLPYIHSSMQYKTLLRPRRRELVCGGCQRMFLARAT
jgi:hypothetical protein